MGGAVQWVTAQFEDDLPEEAEAGEASVSDDSDGGFSSLDGMLQWAIGHSDPVKLKESANDVKRYSAVELKKRQEELKELMEKLKMPSDAELMRIAISDLNNSSISLEDRHRALQELLILVEPIDNANDLNKLSGLVAVIRELDNSESDIRTTAAWVLGKASQNNPFVQDQILELGALMKLMKMTRSSFTEEAVKALYAISALIRNNVGGQEMFYAQAGGILLQEIMSNTSIDIRLRKKSVLLVTDLADFQLENKDRTEPLIFGNHLFLKSVVELTASSDLDLQEKALVAVKTLLQLINTEASVFKDFCGLDGALERMREQFEKLMAEEDQVEFANDMEILRREVDAIFRRKLEKVHLSHDGSVSVLS
ncbi:hypothetical protein QJS04_geneDACA021491 [Acorus gramineus]|uniref:Nucleotide exchange factor Fes1 domain-containing protein n=1 Tax=Acorus gramineus TaxID=55184 RepID=A0AAV9A716_ACOGR|nr:hypothetical protein QJS04_geneDACA021491 [Acorus gramineus]